MSILGNPLKLPCGVVLKNRMVKSPMSDSLGDGAGNPTTSQVRLYERWAQGGVGLSLIGEVQITHRYPEKPGNLVLTNDANRHALEELANRGSINGAQIWPQLGHAGALSYGPISQPKGPSALDLEGLKCEEMSLDEIVALSDEYATAATLAKDLGFGGVQIHAGHGFLLSQFLSPLFNHRTDAYGGSIEGRYRVVNEIIEKIRQVVGPNFPVGIRINATDKLVGGLQQEDALEVVRLLSQSSIDLIDVSGGTYFPGAASSSDGVLTTGPYFVDIAKRAKELTSIPVVVTGGFETRIQAENAVEGGSADAVGFGRAMVLDPSLADSFLLDQSNGPDFPDFEKPPSGGVTAWYTMRLTALGEDNEYQFSLSPAQALETYEIRDADRCNKWRSRFG